MSETYEGILEPETIITEPVNNEPVVNDSVINETVNEKPETKEKKQEEPLRLAFLGRQGDKKRVGNKAVAWERLYADLEFNIRDPENYTPVALQILRDMLNLEGQKEAIVCSLQADGRLKVIKGHRRYSSMLLDRNDDLKTLSEGRGKLLAENVRWQYVLVDIRKDMGTEDEVVEMLDHGGRKGLEASEIFKAVMRLTNLGSHWNEAKIGVKLGLPRGKMTNHFKVAKLPKETHEPYRQYLAKDPKAPLRFPAEVVNELYSAWEQDKKKGDYTVGGGAEFRAKWQEVKEKSGHVQSKAKSVKSTVEDFLGRAQNYHQLLVYLGKHLMGETENIPNYGDVLDKIGHALNEVYPREDPEVKVIEEGITRDV